jgi:cyclophilin family peptidyl-prolyl cis-trans isomerase
MPSAKRERQREGRQARAAAAAAEQKRRQRFRSVRNFAIIVVVIIAAIFVLSRRGGDDKKPVTAGSSSSSSSSAAPAAFTFGTGACPNADGSSPKTIDFTAAPQKCIDPAKTYTATFDTTAGPLVVKLDTQTTLGTANNFVVLARYHYYDGTQLFRTAQSIGIIQGGSPHDNSTGDKGPGYTLPDEGFDYASLPQSANGATGGPYKYSPGDLVMARRAQANGASAQFFFAVNGATANLDSQGVYVKFGTATQGVDVLTVILATAPPDQPPNPPVAINKVTITES